MGEIPSGLVVYSCGAIVGFVPVWQLMSCRAAMGFFMTGIDDVP